MHVYLGEEEDEMTDSFDTKGATCMTWHRATGRYIFAVSSTVLNHAYLIETNSSRNRQQWLSSLHEHGAIVIQPPKYGEGEQGKYCTEIKGHLKMLPVDITEDSGTCESAVIALRDYLQQERSNQLMVADHPQKVQEAHALVKGINKTKIKLRKMTEARDQAEAQVKELEKVNQKLQAIVEGANIQDKAALAKMEMENHKTARTAAKLQIELRSQAETVLQLEKEKEELAKRVAELERQKKTILHNTVESMENRMMHSQDRDEGRGRSWSKLLTGESSEARDHDPYHEEAASAGKVAELMATVDKQAAQIRELNAIQEEMEGTMLMLEAAHDEHKKSQRGSPQQGTRSFARLTVVNRQLNEDQEELKAKHQALEHDAEHLLDELIRDKKELQETVLFLQQEKDEIEASADALIDEVTKEKEEAQKELAQLLGKSLGSGNSAASTAEVAALTKQLAEIKDENTRIKLKQSRQTSAGSGMTADEELLELREEKQVLLEEMLSQKDDMDQMEAVVNLKEQQIAELEQDTVMLEGKIMRLAELQRGNS